MAINTKAIKSRISSVKNTKKITKAMEMIAAVKMRKAVQMAVRTRDYAILANDMLQSVSSGKMDHPLARVNAKIDDDGESIEPEKELVIVITSNKGLCGGYNSKVQRKLYEYVSQPSSADPSTLLRMTAPEIDVIAIGLKGAQRAKQYGANVLEVYERLHENPEYEEIFPISKNVIESFNNGEYKKVSIIFTNYISGLTQVVEHKQLLPITQEQIDEFIEKGGAEAEKDLGQRGDDKAELADEIEDTLEHEYEPNKKAILNYVLPMLIEIQIYQALLESAASEHSSRMIAMKNATESAGDMIDDLTLEFNKGRQAAITQEVAEIVSGANALGN